MKKTLLIILFNLVIGNGILFFAGKSSFNENINYALMIGMSLACALFYLLFFKYSNVETFGNLKLIVLNILGCVIIIFFGNLFALLIKEPIKDVLTNLPATILMGIMGNILMFPISVFLGLVNSGITTYLKKQ